MIGGVVYIYIYIYKYIYDSYGGDDIDNMSHFIWM